MNRAGPASHNREHGRSGSLSAAKGKMEPKAVYIPGGCGARQSTGSRPAPRILFSLFLTGEPLQDLNRKKRSQEFLYLYSSLADRIPCTYIVSDLVFFLFDVYKYESYGNRGICGAG